MPLSNELRTLIGTIILLFGIIIFFIFCYKCAICLEKKEKRETKKINVLPV